MGLFLDMSGIDAEEEKEDKESSITDDLIWNENPYPTLYGEEHSAVPPPPPPPPVTSSTSHDVDRTLKKDLIFLLTVV